MKIKRIIVSIILSVSLLSLFSCVSAEPAKMGEPAYSEDKTMFIGAFNCPFPNDEQYKWLGESGINHLIINDRLDAGVGTPLFYEEPLKLAEKNNFKIIINSHNQPYTYYYRPEYINKKAFAGFNVFDEPGADDFKDLSTHYQTYKAKYPDFPYYVDLFPMYAEEIDLNTKTYEEYVQRYTNEVLSKIESNKIMISDIYPLLKHSTLYDGWLRNLEILQENAQKVNAEMYIYLQEIAFSNRRNLANYDDLRFQCYTNMAYGATGIYHFPYQTPDISNVFPVTSYSAIDREGKKTVVYDYVKKLNEELFSFDDIFLSFDWQSISVNVGSINKQEDNEYENANFKKLKNTVSNYGIVKSYTSSRDLIIGNFKDANDYKGYMLVNFTDPTLKLSNDIDVEFKGAKKAILVKNGVKQIVDLENGHYKETLVAGEGQFIIPFN